MADDASASRSAELTPDERAVIDGMYLRLASSNHYELLGVDRAADRRTIRDAYFALSQRFHPDAWYGRPLGDWKARIEVIFRDLTRAYDVLSNRNARSAYDLVLGPAPAGVSAPPPTGRTSTEPDPPRPVSAPVAAPPVDPNAPIVPQRYSPAAPVTAKHAIPQPVNVDHAAAVRAARENLARKLSSRGSGQMPITRPPPVAAPKPTGPQSPLSEGGGSMESFQSSRLAREEAERRAKVGLFVKAGEDSLARNDLVGASNSFVVAAGLAPDDAELRARAEDLQLRVAASLADRYAEQARGLERSNRFDQAVPIWQKALQGRPNDPLLLVRAAAAMVRARVELPRAAELARRAMQLSPRSLEAVLTLGEVYLVGGMKASAQAAVDAASKLDPTSPLVKDLQARVKG